MHDLGRIVARGIGGKDPLPDPYPEWGKRGIHIYPGSVHLFAGMAGTYKTMITLGAVINMAVPSFVFSTDSDDLTMAARLLGNATSQPAAEMRLLALKNPRAAADILAKHYGHIKWSFDSDQTGDGIWHNLYAYATRYGEYPRLVVADILSDVIFDSADSEWAALRIAMKQFNIVARETGAAVILVHHVSEGARTNDMYPCPGRNDIMGKDLRHPVVIMTFGKDSAGDLHAACVKNRHGAADATGRTSFRMLVDPVTSRVSDYDPARARLRVVTSGWSGWGTGEEEE
jgi:hypothetical protein